MTLAIVIPSIEGREQDLERCLSAYKRTAPKAKTFIEMGHESCGKAWVTGARRAAAEGFDYLHFTADDLEPHTGWLKVAVETVKAEMIPAPLVFNPDGSLDSAGLQNFGQYRGPHTDWQLTEGTTVPFISHEMWKAIRPAVEDVMSRIHYCTDLLVSTAGRKAGFETAIRTGMRFTHHVAPAGRNYGRALSDTQEYRAWAAAS